MQYHPPPGSSNDPGPITTLKTALGEIEHALAQSESVDPKVQEATATLALVVNRALKAEVGERRALQAELADVTEQRDAERHAALHDPLTGLPNRLLFDDRLEYALAQAARFGWSLAVLYLDVDGFKAINDSHGHGVGDAVLKAVAQRLKTITRNADTVSRYGGDEFLYLFSGTIADQDVKTIADKVVKAVVTPLAIGEGDARLSLTVSVSVGIAVYPKHGTTAEALIRSADTAMYQAKQNGQTVSTA